MAPGAGSAAYRRVYDACYPQVLAYLVRRVGSQDAADLAAEVFTVAWRRIDDVPSGDGALPWLYGVAYRVVSHHWRTRGRRRRLFRRLGSLAEASTPNPEIAVVRRREYELVLHAASKLRPKDQEVLRLAVWEELSHDQIAELLGASVPAVRQRFHRAKRALAREFERSGGSIPPSAVAQEGGGQ